MRTETVLELGTETRTELDREGDRMRREGVEDGTVGGKIQDCTKRLSRLH